MKKKVRCISLLTAALLLLSSCTSTNEPSTSLATKSTDIQTETADTVDAEEEVTDEMGIFIPGTYTGTAEGHGGPLEVEVTVDENTIQSGEVTKDSETQGIGDVAIKKITAAILANQNVDVDIVSGCTISANAVRLAAIDALEQAAQLFRRKVVLKTLLRT